MKTDFFPVQLSCVAQIVTFCFVKHLHFYYQDTGYSVSCSVGPFRQTVHKKATKRQADKEISKQADTQANRRGKFNKNNITRTNRHTDEEKRYLEPECKK